jgi:hypothetical protein
VADDFEPGTPSVYVSADGNDDENSGTEDMPFATLEKAYAATKGDVANKRIVVLSNLGAEGTVKLNGTDAEGDAVTIEGKYLDLKIERTGGQNGSVITVTNGAKVKFKNIFIDGKRGGSSGNYHRALEIGGQNTEVTLENRAKITGKKMGDATAAAPLNGSGVRLYDAAKLVMNNGSSVVNCELAGTCIGTVMIQSGAKLEMNAGSLISGNTADNGGAVYVHSLDNVSSGKSEFVMNDGEMSDNKAVLNYGGGVSLSNGKFTMNNGKLLRNESKTHGGAVYVLSASNAGENCKSEFIMENGEISGNNSERGGGVSLSYGSFTMKNGEIRSNASTADGGGVHIVQGGFFTMEGGEISLNSSKIGGGVYVYNHNTAKFTMTGGTIYGNDEAGYGKSNVFTDGGNSAALFKGAQSIGDPSTLATSNGTVTIPSN